MCPFSNLSGEAYRSIAAFISGEHTRFGSFYILLFLYISILVHSFIIYLFLHLSPLLLLFIFPISHPFHPSLPSFLHLSSLLHFHLPPSLLIRWQRLSWPPLTWKQALLSWEPLVVRMKWCTSIFRCLPLKTIRNGLGGALVPELQILRTVWRSKARHRGHTDACSHHTSVPESLQEHCSMFHYTLLMNTGI